MDYEVIGTFSLDGNEYYEPGEVITEDDPKIIQELLTKKLIKPPPSARKITKPKPKPTTIPPPPEDEPDNLADLESVTPELAAEINGLGIINFEQLESADVEMLTQINGVDLVLAERIKKEASAVFSDEE